MWENHGAVELMEVNGVFQGCSPQGSVMVLDKSQSILRCGVGLPEKWRVSKLDSRFKQLSINLLKWLGLKFYRLDLFS